ncbi:MAG: hypothetical protein O3C40_27005 [Planctomycetota bacterium]|nr:hypothetical protein [Planctomycetota bacterium]
MASIQLPDWNHVQARDEQPNPTGHEIGIQLRVGCHLAGLIAGWLHGIHDQPHGERGIDLIGARGGDGKVHLRDSDPRDRDRHQQTGERPRDADIKHFPAIGAHPIHANHGPHRPDRTDGKRNEVGKAGRDSISQGC